MQQIKGKKLSQDHNVVSSCTNKCQLKLSCHYVQLKQNAISDKKNSYPHYHFSDPYFSHHNYQYQTLHLPLFSQGHHRAAEGLSLSASSVSVSYLSPLSLFSLCRLNLNRSSTHQAGTVSQQVIRSYQPQKKKKKDN